MSEKENKDKPKDKDVKMTIEPVILKSDIREIKALYIPKKEKESKEPKKE